MPNKTYYIPNGASWLATDHHIPIERMVTVPIRQYNFEDRIYFNFLARADRANINKIFCDVEISRPNKQNFKPGRKDLKLLLKMMKDYPISINEYINAEQKLRAIFGEKQRYQKFQQKRNVFQEKIDKIEKEKLLKKEMEIERQKRLQYLREMEEARHQVIDENKTDGDNVVDDDDDDGFYGGVLGVYGRSS
ncbi:hypothetical protein ACF0H5_007383 [Mactra antiquata]